MQPLTPEQITILEDRINSVTLPVLTQLVTDAIPAGVPRVGFPRVSQNTIDNAVSPPRRGAPVQRYQLWFIRHILLAHIPQAPELYYNEFDNNLNAGFAKYVAKDVRNVRQMAARTGLPHGPEALIASMVSGIPNKSAAQQNDMLKESAGIHGPAPDRRGMNGGRRKSRKTRRRRHTRRR